MSCKLLCFVIISAFSLSNAYAYPLDSGLIKGYLPYANGTKEIFFFKLEGTAVSGCNTTRRYAINSDSKNFKSVVSAVMASFHSKQSVKVHFSEACNAYSNAFDANYICVGDIPC